VCVVANLKPAKLAGQASEAMVLAAEAADSSGKLIVRTLLPPGGLCNPLLLHWIHTLHCWYVAPAAPLLH
jgi:tRNA-binding EMAP/Myf-like protein